MKNLLFAAIVTAALSGVAAEPCTRGFGKPWVIVAEEFGAFFTNPENEMTKAGVERYVDSILAGSKISHVFWCAVAGRANFELKATEPIWAGLDDPATEFGIVKTECGGYLPAEKPETIAKNRRWVENAKKLHDAGVDFGRVLIDRTHARGAEAWFTVRMTDMLFAHCPHHFRTPSFFAQNPDLLIPAGHGGGSPDYVYAKSRDWVVRVVAETAARYKDLDGIEIDLVTDNFWLFGKAPEPGEEPRPEMFARFFTDLKKALVRETGNPKAKLAARVVHDTNFLDAHFCTPGTTFPVDVMIPCPHEVRHQPLEGWAEIDRWGPCRVMPAFAVNDLSLPRIAGRLSWVRGYGFPGVMLVGLERSNALTRKAVCADGLVDFDKGVTGSREFALVPNEHLAEWKRGAWGYVDVRGTYPWALDLPWKYAFALQEGSVAAKSVVAKVSYSDAGIPPAVYLNGRKSTGCRKMGTQAAYTFPKTAVIGGVNQLYIPVQAREDDLELEDDKPPAITAVSGASVEVDM